MPVWRWRRLRRGPANLLEAGEDFDGAPQACMTLAKCSTGPCKPVWRWRRLRRGPASLLDAGEVFDEAMQACAGLIYCISRPHLSAQRLSFFRYPFTFAADNELFTSEAL